MLDRPGVEAVFAGHVHNWWLDTIGDTRFYMLPSTAFLRHDYAEFYRVEPIIEFGRGDIGRFGYYLIDVHDDGHIAYSLRTWAQRVGVLESPRADADDPAEGHAATVLAHPRLGTLPRVGVELRHPWAEEVEIPATGGVEEFGRKRARNDYPIQALLESSLSLVKVPVQDLLDERVAERMRLLHGEGVSFIVTSIGVPRGVPADAASFGVVSFEVNLPRSAFAGAMQDLQALRAETGVAVTVCKIRGEEDSHFDGVTYNHFVNTGHRSDELEADRADLVELHAAGAIDAVTVRAEAATDLPQMVADASSFAASTGIDVLLAQKLKGPNIATPGVEDRRVTWLALAAAVCTSASEGVSVVFDPFMDVDRGYYPRRGFIDRRYDPREALLAVTGVAGLALGSGRVTMVDASRWSHGVLHFEVDGSPCWLLDESQDAPTVELPAPAWWTELGRHRTVVHEGPVGTDGNGLLLVAGAASSPERHRARRLSDGVGQPDASIAVRCTIMRVASSRRTVPVTVMSSSTTCLARLPAPLPEPSRVRSPTVVARVRCSRSAPSARLSSSATFSMMPSL